MLLDNINVFFFLLLHFRWGDGDIIMENNADFLNYGKIIMANGSTFDANNMYLGTILPKENGGDLFAANYHSYDLDSGNLNYIGKIL